MRPETLLTSDAGRNERPPPSTDTWLPGLLLRRFGAPRRDVDGLPWRRWLLISALLVMPISTHGAEALFLLYLMAVGAATAWRELPSRRLSYLAAWVIAGTLWLASGTTGDAGWQHPLAAAHRHPVSLFDYLLMLFGFALMAVDRYSLRDLRAVLSALVATVPVHFLLALGQRYLGWDAFWAILPIGHGRLLEVNLRIPELLAGRITAGLGNPNRLAAYSLICCAAASALLASEWPDLRAPGARRLQRLPVAALASIVVCCLLMLVWSGSRGAWLAAIALSIPAAWLIGIRWRYMAGATTAASIVVACAVSELGALTVMARRVVPAVVWGRLISTPPSGMRVSSPQWRLRVYRCAWDLANEHPLRGWGVGGWVDECERRLSIVMNHAHNIFLQVAVESGWIAAIALVASLAWALGASVRQIDQQQEPAARKLYGGLLLIAIAILLTNQTSMVLMLSARLQIVFATALALPYSLVFHRTVR